MIRVRLLHCVSMATLNDTSNPGGPISSTVSWKPPAVKRTTSPGPLRFGFRQGQGKVMWARRSFDHRHLERVERVRRREAGTRHLDAERGRTAADAPFAAPGHDPAFGLWNIHHTLSSPPKSLLRSHVAQAETPDAVRVRTDQK